MKPKPRSWQLLDTQSHVCHTKGQKSYGALSAMGHDTVFENGLCNYIVFISGV